MMNGWKKGITVLSRTILLLLALATLLGCEENALNGSLADFYDVSFDSVRARLYSSELAIEYVRENGEVPVRLSVRASGRKLRTGEYNLKTSGSVTGRSGDTDIPQLASGTLELDEFSAKNGSNVVGSFDASFSAGEDELSLSGDFEASLEVIDNTGGYDLDGYPYPDVEEVLEDDMSEEQ